jgi:hypothetical protein
MIHKKLSYIKTSSKPPVIAEAGVPVSAIVAPFENPFGIFLCDLGTLVSLL